MKYRTKTKFKVWSFMIVDQGNLNILDRTVDLNQEKKKYRLSYILTITITRPEEYLVVSSPYINYHLFCGVICSVFSCIY